MSPEILDQPKLIGATNTLILDNIHTLPDEVQTETTGLNFVEPAAAQLCGVDRGTLVAEQDFQAVSHPGRARRHAPTVKFDGLIGLSVIAMAHDVGQSFVHRARDRAAVGRRKAEDLRKTFERATHNEE